MARTKILNFGFLIFLFISFSGKKVMAQASYGIFVQAYPTGIVPGIFLHFPTGKKSIMELRGGYNFLNHGDAGVQLDEKGGGFGGSLGYHYFFTKVMQRWTIGIRNDIWFNEVNWKKELSTGVIVDGKSDIVVIQPTLTGGYTFDLGPLRLNPNLAFGYEVNVVTKYQEVGQGAIILLGIELSLN